MTVRTAWPTFLSGDSFSAAQSNTYNRDNDLAYWVFTTAGDMAYATASNALARLAIGAAGQYLGVTAGVPAWKNDGVPGIFTTAGDLVYGTGADVAARLGLTTGGLLYGGASAPAYLPKGTALQQLRMNSAGAYPEWAARTLPLHASGIAFGSITTSSTSYVDVTSATFNLTLTKTCTIIALAYGVAYTNSGTYLPYFRTNIDGTGDGTDIPMQRLADFTPGQPFTTMWFRNSIAAGTRTVKLQCKMQAAETLTVSYARIMGFAIEE